jgi:hypothetical protein
MGDPENGNSARHPAGNQSKPIEKEEERYGKKNQMVWHYYDGDGIVACSRQG